MRRAGSYQGFKHLQSSQNTPVDGRRDPNRMTVVGVECGDEGLSRCRWVGEHAQ